jgi:NADPH2:quinone reductase
VLDIVGGDYFERNLRCLALEAGSDHRVPARQPRHDRLPASAAAAADDHQSTLRASPTRRKAEIARSLREKVWPLFEAGKLKPVVDRVFPLAQAAAAHALMESSAHIGKLMLEVAPG